MTLRAESPLGNPGRTKDPTSNGKADPGPSYFVYPDRDGKPLYRAAHRSGEVSYERQSKGKWVKGLGPITPIPYRLDLVAKADPAGLVFIADDEPGVNALTDAGLVATCCVRDSSWGHSDWPPFLEGRRVGVIGKTDEFGRQESGAVALHVAGAAADVRVVEPPGLTPAGGVASWVVHTRSAKIDPAEVLRAEFDISEPPEPPEPPTDDGFVGSVGEPDQDVPIFTGPPNPLKMDLLPVHPLPPGLIPEALRDWLLDVSKRGCFPLEYPTASALAALSSLVGRSLTIRPKRHDSWTVVPNLWGMIVGPPGLQKTPAVEETFLPLRRLVAEAIKVHAEAKARAAEDAAIAEAKAVAAKRKLAEAAKKGAPDDVLRRLAAEANPPEAQEEARVKRYIVNDATVEKLGELLSENPRGLLQFRDELSGWLRSMDRQGHESDRGFYLESWNGNGSYTFDRIGRGTVHVDALCMSIFGTIQPGPLARYLKGAASGEDADGFVPRFQILLYPDAPRHFVNVDRWPDTPAKTRAFEVFQWIDAMNAADLGAELDEDRGLHFIRFDDDAQAMFDEWRVELENRLRGESENSLMNCHLSKYRSLMPSLALLFHLVDSAGTYRLDPVTLDAAERAAAWCELLESHARRVYQSACEGDPEAAARLGERIKQSLPNPFTFRQVAVKGWAGLDNVEDVRKAVGILEDRNWAKVVTRPPGAKGGRPSEEVWVNPAIQKEGSL